MRNRPSRELPLLPRPRRFGRRPRCLPLRWRRRSRRAAAQVQPPRRAGKTDVRTHVARSRKRVSRRGAHRSRAHPSFEDRHSRVQPIRSSLLGVPARSSLSHGAQADPIYSATSAPPRQGTISKPSRRVSSVGRSFWKEGAISGRRDDDRSNAARVRGDAARCRRRMGGRADLRSRAQRRFLRLAKKLRPIERFCGHSDLTGGAPRPFFLRAIPVKPGWDSANVAEAEPHRWFLGGSRARIAWRLASV